MKRFSQIFSFSDSDSDLEQPSRGAIRKFETRQGMQKQLKKLTIEGNIAKGKAEESDMESGRKEIQSSGNI